MLLASEAMSMRAGAVTSTDRPCSWAARVVRGDAATGTPGDTPRADGRYGRARSIPAANYSIGLAGTAYMVHSAQRDKALKTEQPHRNGDGVDASEVSRAVVGAISTASSLGLAANDSVVLHNSNKLTLRLLPCDVVARVAPADQQEAQLEVDLAQQLVALDCPVAALDRRVEPRVYERDSYVITFWTYYEPIAPQVSPVNYANALRRLHDGMRTLDIRTPRFTDRAREAEQLVADHDQ